MITAKDMAMEAYKIYLEREGLEDTQDNLIEFMMDFGHPSMSRRSSWEPMSKPGYVLRIRLYPDSDFGTRCSDEDFWNDYDESGYLGITKRWDTKEDGIAGAKAIITEMRENLHCKDWLEEYMVAFFEDALAQLEEHGFAQTEVGGNQEGTELRFAYHTPEGGWFKDEEYAENRKTENVEEECDDHYVLLAIFNTSEGYRVACEDEDFVDDTAWDGSAHILKCWEIGEGELAEKEAKRLITEMKENSGDCQWGDDSADELYDDALSQIEESGFAEASHWNIGEIMFGYYVSGEGFFSCPRHAEACMNAGEGCDA